MNEICEKTVKVQLFLRKNVARKKTAEMSPIFRFFDDFGAVWGTENRPKVGKNGAEKTTGKRPKKSEKTLQNFGPGTGSAVLRWPPGR